MADEQTYNQACVVGAMVGVQIGPVRSEPAARVVCQACNLVIGTFVEGEQATWHRWLLTHLEKKHPAVLNPSSGGTY